MKHFKRMLILNWHYIHHEMIELESINFLTGKNASGKSTLIDAMQLLLLGDTAGRYFNKAANDKSSRTLVGYLRGELSDQDTTFNYIRNKDFTSHLVLEVYDDEKDAFFLIGFVADVTGDQYNHQFYIADTTLPSDQFIDNKKAKSKQDIKNYFKNHNISFDFFNSNTQYREHFKFRMGQINDNYFSLFKKAVPFTPITDIKAFITEFICDAENNVDISDMKDNIRYYERMKEGAEEIENMIADLEQIQATFNRYSSEKEKVYMYEFLLDYAKYQNLLDSKEQLESDLENNKVQMVNLKREAISLEERYQIFSEDIESKRIHLRDFEPYRLKARYEEKIGQLEREIKGIHQNVDLNKKRFIGRLIKWKAANQSTLKAPIQNAIEALENHNFDFNIQETTQIINAYSQEVNQNYYELNSEQNQRHKNIVSVEQIIKNLKEGIKDYPKPVVTLKNLLVEKLNEDNHENVEVKILCEMIEIKDKRWTNAIEGYLHTQKFHLIVEPKYFLKALKIYDEHKLSLNLHGVGLVDIEKIKQHHIKIKEHALSESIECHDENVKKYIEYLLGQVVKCDRVEDLRHHRVGITDSCMLYKNYVATQMNPKRYKFPFIGQQASLQQIELRSIELNDLKKEYRSREEGLKHLKKLMHIETFNEDMIEDYAKAGCNYKQLIILQKELSENRDHLSQIDMSSIFVLEEEIQIIDKKMKTIQEQLIEVKANIKQSIDKTESLELKKPEIERQIKAGYQGIQGKYSEAYMTEYGMVRFNSEMKRLHEASKIIDNFEKVLTGSINKESEIKKDLIELRSAFNRVYRRDLGTTSEENTKYDHFLEDLKKTELPSFKAQINTAIEKAQQEFQDDFISKLKSNIDEVDRQIKALNNALKFIRFGKDSYKFSVKPNSYYRAYYDMIMDKDLMEGYSLFSYDFKEKHGDVIQELFKQIIDVGEGALSIDEKEELEKNIQKYTDYRTYLDFDLIVTNDSGETQHLSKMIDKKSGGETQTPFYISVLASFSKVYRINHLKNNNTMRLIIFDEAFSKMDHERIEESLKLLRKMGFQALISAPTEKIANIAPLADKTLCVLRNKKSTMIREFDVIKDWI